MGEKNESDIEIALKCVKIKKKKKKEVDNDISVKDSESPSLNDRGSKKKKKKKIKKDKMNNDSTRETNIECSEIPVENAGSKCLAPKSESTIRKQNQDSDTD